MIYPLLEIKKIFILKVFIKKKVLDTHYKHRKIGQKHLVAYQFTIFLITVNKNNYYAKPTKCVALIVTG